MLKQQLKESKEASQQLHELKFKVSSSNEVNVFSRQSEMIDNPDLLQLNKKPPSAHFSFRDDPMKSSKDGIPPELPKLELP